MAIITLTSDWGTKDFYLAVVKGIILQQLPDVTMVDISHEIPPFNLSHASFIVRNSYPGFPQGTVHIIDINSDTPAKNHYYIVGMEGQYFIAPDNGLFALIFDKNPDEIIEIEVPEAVRNSTFISRDLFAPLACKLAAGMKAEEFGKHKDLTDQMVSFNPVIDDDVIRGKVIYIDSYENAFLNISETLFKKVGKGRSFTIYFRTLDYGIQKISKSYGDVPEGEILAIFSTTGLLEIAMNKGNAAGLLGLKTDEMVRVEFRN